VCDVGFKGFKDKYGLKVHGYAVRFEVKLAVKLGTWVCSKI